MPLRSLHRKILAWLGRFRATERSVLNERPNPAEPEKLPLNWLVWEVTKAARSIDVYVVEPKECAPRDHERIFGATLDYLLRPERTRLDPFSGAPRPRAIPRFDLITFPESFLPAESLIAFLTDFAPAVEFGCIHVGLRPTATDTPHMFSVNELFALVGRLRRIPTVDTGDLVHFQNWLDRQAGDARKVNLACVVSKDRFGSIRLCLHPKSIPSKWEYGTDDATQMLEGDLVSTITLRPDNYVLQTLTVQPVICSDVLELHRDRIAPGLLDALNVGGHLLQAAPPDHIDVVTVATNSPHTPDSPMPLFWSRQFLASFVKSTAEMERHRHKRAIFALSNFGRFSVDRESTVAGLSGIFVPTPPAYQSYPEFVKVFAYGKRGNRYDWSVVERTETDREARAHMVVLNSQATGDAVQATILGFTIHRLPGDIGAADFCPPLTVRLAELSASDESFRHRGTS